MAGVDGRHAGGRGGGREGIVRGGSSAAAPRSECTSRTLCRTLSYLATLRSGRMTTVDEISRELATEPEILDRILGLLVVRRHVDIGEQAVSKVAMSAAGREFYRSVCMNCEMR